ncbi:oxidoreductase [Streptomyces sp. NBC_00986]|uniref:oxidoreductase n=1 Tax=Streptomyces sp. NBC_00986 TaxID=2903702 RepID=UPI0038699093|nr:oxidoreductase [Streptomyces sp. NBC_00986]WSX64543.1 oxidoreductase [Streptomyces sp. NBC_00986]
MSEPDLKGVTALVTGANSGIGLPTARELARRGAHVLIACRNETRGRAAVEHIRRTTGTETEYVPLDLASLASVHALADRLADRLDGLDLLINNAGVGLIARRLTEDGFEKQFGTNHLGHFALTGRLLPLLTARPQARVVTVTSDSHEEGEIDFDDLAAERKYGRMSAYARSKLANLLFAQELQRRAVVAGLDLLSLAVHPGTTATNIGALPKPVKKLVGLFLQSADKGAEPTLYAATSPGARPSGYYGPGPAPLMPADRALDKDLAVRLWEISEKLTDVPFLLTHRPGVR